MRNVLKCYPLTKKYYLTHPWEFISQSFSNLRAARERIIRGFAARDTWNLDNYLIELLPDMVEHLKNNSHSYPDGFDTFEEWQEVLENDIIVPLRNAQEDKTPFVRKFNNVHYKKDDETVNELWHNFVKQEREIFEWRTSQLKLGLKNLGEHFWGLWD